MDIHNRIQAGEGSTLEFKREFPDKDQALATIVAFANTTGGELLIGVDDADGSVAGVDPGTARGYEAIQETRTSPDHDAGVAYSWMSFDQCGLRGLRAGSRKPR